MIPWYKVTSLVVRIFAKPMIAHAKKISAEESTFASRTTRRFFIFLGNKYHIIEIYINRRFLKSESKDFFNKPLKDDAALEKGLII